MLTQKCLLVFSCLIITLTSFGQKKSPIHEVGLSVNTGLNFGLFYKTGSEKSLFRLQTLFLNGMHHARPNGINTNNYGFGISLGSEFRQNIAENLFLFYGFGAGVRYTGQNFVNNGTIEQYETTFSPTINLVVGVNYVLKDRWVFAVEALPYLRYDIITSQGGISNLGVVSGRISYGFNMESVRLTIAHRFSQKSSRNSK